ncbi:MAG: hypothetical protein WCL04_03390 [Verrucomicrobiota bacterium]
MLFPGGGEGEEAGFWETEGAWFLATGDEQGGKYAEVRFVTDDGKIGGGRKFSEQAGDFGGVVFRHEEGFTDLHDGLTEALSEQGGSFTGTANGAIPKMRRRSVGMGAKNI